MYLSPSEVRVSSATENVIQIIGELRPQLHRYCARLVGSVVDGEDIVQESILKALEALAKNGTIQMSWTTRSYARIPTTQPHCRPSGYSRPTPMLIVTNSQG
jgi:hypothetical protein